MANRANIVRIKKCPGCGLACGVAKHVCEGCGHAYAKASGEVASPAEQQRAMLIRLQSAARTVIIHVQRERARDGDSLNGFPGHSHREPGRWDSDGSICRECLDWQKLMIAVERVRVPRKPSRVIT